MNKEKFLLDTHALIFWACRSSVSDEFIMFFDRQALNGNVIVSSASFWETAFLVRRKRVSITDTDKWKDELLQNTNITCVDPDASEMIESVSLPEHHKDPFDRLLLIQARRRNAHLVSRDRIFEQYGEKVFWIF
jgi:PIN domain nuclease of toxin-antitoxin system